MLSIGTRVKVACKVNGIGQYKGGLINEIFENGTVEVIWDDNTFSCPLPNRLISIAYQRDDKVDVLSTLINKDDEGYFVKGGTIATVNHDNTYNLFCCNEFIIKVEPHQLRRSNHVDGIVGVTVSESPKLNLVAPSPAMTVDSSMITPIRKEEDDNDEDLIQSGAVDFSHLSDLSEIKESSTLPTKIENASVIINKDVKFCDVKENENTEGTNDVEHEEGKKEDKVITNKNVLQENVCINNTTKENHSVEISKTRFASSSRASTDIKKPSTRLRTKRKLSLGDTPIATEKKQKKPKYASRRHSYPLQKDIEKTKVAAKSSVAKSFKFVFLKGDLVIYRSKTHQVTKAHLDGTFDLISEHGLLFLSVPSDMVQKFTLSDFKKNITVGMRVMANYFGDGGYYFAVIAAVDLKTCTLSLNYDDADREDDVSLNQIRLITPKERKILIKTVKSFTIDTSKKAIKAEKGLRVMGEYLNEGIYYPGIIYQAHADGTFDLNYDDGDREDNVPRSRFRYFYDKEKSSYVIPQQLKMRIE